MVLPEKRTKVPTNISESDIGNRPEMAETVYGLEASKKCEVLVVNKLRYFSRR